MANSWPIAVAAIVSSLVLFGSHVNGALTTVPKDGVRVIGTNIQLGCAVDAEDGDAAVEPFQWQYTSTSNIPTRIVYNCQVNPSFADLYEVEETNTSCNLVILSATVKSAGTYTCQTGFDQASGTITMLESNLTCSYNTSDVINGDFIRLQCYVNYNGTAVPRVEWRSGTTGFPLYNYTTNTNPTQVNTFIDLPVYVPTSWPHTCTLYFDSPITYRYTWTLPTIYVQYFLTDILVTLKHKYFDVVTLTCSANGYPPATYIWTDTVNGTASDGASVSFPAAGLNQYRCEATNTIRGESKALQQQIATDFTEDAPAYCPSTTTTTTTTPTPEPTTAEEVQTTVSEEPEVTTEEVITTQEPAGDCGRLMHVAPTTAPDGWSRPCYIAQNDTTQRTMLCRDLIVDLPPNFVDYSDLILRGGNFGCAVTTRIDFVDFSNACYDNYQQTARLSSCSSCTRLYICIRLPSGYYPLRRHVH